MLRVPTRFGQQDNTEPDSSRAELVLHVIRVEHTTSGPRPCHQGKHERSGAKEPGFKGLGCVLAVAYIKGSDTIAASSLIR